MKELKRIRERKSEVYSALQNCSEELRNHLQLIYDYFDKEETLLMESLDLESD